MRLVTTGLGLLVLAWVLLALTAFAQQTICSRLPGGQIVCTTPPTDGHPGRRCTTTTLPGGQTVTSCD